MNWRLFLFIFLVIFGLLFSLPSFLNIKNMPKINLGLDLQGGIHLVLGIKKEKAIENRIKSFASNLKYFSEDNEILIDKLEVNKDGFSFILLDNDEKEKVIDFLKNLEEVQFNFKENRDGVFFKVNLKEGAKEKIYKEALKQAIEVIKSRLDMFGLTEPVVAKYSLGGIYRGRVGIGSL